MDVNLKVSNLENPSPLSEEFKSDIFLDWIMLVVEAKVRTVHRVKQRHLLKAPVRSDHKAHKVNRTKNAAE